MLAVVQQNVSGGGALVRKADVERSLRGGALDGGRWRCPGVRKGCVRCNGGALVREEDIQISFREGRVYEGNK
eukprot:4630624-Karenia_brevis.AAC.1